MQKIKMSRGVTLTFEKGCKRYLENCRQRNLREGTMQASNKNSGTPISRFLKKLRKNLIKNWAHRKRLFAYDVSNIFCFKGEFLMLKIQNSKRNEATF